MAIEGNCHWLGKMCRHEGRKSAIVKEKRQGVKGANMSQITYKVVKHDGGWAY
jgi:hypothetical protein